MADEKPTTDRPLDPAIKQGSTATSDVKAESKDVGVDAESRLEEGLEETMDGSDPVSITQPGTSKEPPPSSGYNEEEEKKR